jgi:hypothetical protein
MIAATIKTWCTSQRGLSSTVFSSCLWQNRTLSRIQAANCYLLYNKYITLEWFVPMVEHHAQPAEYALSARRPLVRSIPRLQLNVAIRLLPPKDLH